MKFRKIFLITILIFVLSLVTACGESTKEPEGIKVTYELNGGIFQNCTLPIIQYYKYNDNQKKLIYSPEKFVIEDSITNTGYTLEGWYTEPEFINKWNFETDTITDEGITLYAKWEKVINYLYNVCYINEKGEKVVINHYKVNAGDCFEDKRNFADKRDGYTPFKYKDQYGNDWDFSYKHPGGPNDLAIDVIVDYIEGTYQLVYTKDDFINAVKKGKNIYLLNDIDLENEVIDFKNISNYEFIGNFHTVSNFVINCEIKYAQEAVVDFQNPESYCAYISLFGEITKSKVVDVTFENVKFKISVTPARVKTIYISPLAKSIIDSEVKNVSINASYECVTLPKDFIEEDRLFIFNQEYIVEVKNSTISENLVNIEKENK